MGAKDNKRQPQGAGGKASPNAKGYDRYAKAAKAANAAKAAKAGESTKPAVKRAPRREPSTAFQRLVEIIKVVDLVIEVLDGRVPISTRHPGSSQIFGNKPRLTIYSKMDLADMDQLRKLTASATENTLDNYHHRSLILSLKSRDNKSKFIEQALGITGEKRDALARKGLLPRPMRAIVVGIPNVGKSSLINWFVGQKRTKVGDSPGVTKGTQWIRVDPQLELLDTPGILPHVAMRPEVHDKLAFMNLVPASTYNLVEIAQYGIKLMQEQYPKRLDEYCPGLSEAGEGLMHIAEVKRYLSSGARLDDLRAANIFLRDVRDGKLGRITLD